MKIKKLSIFILLIIILTGCGKSDVKVNNDEAIRTIYYKDEYSVDVVVSKDYVEYGAEYKNTAFINKDEAISIDIYSNKSTMIDALSSDKEFDEKAKEDYYYKDAKQTKINGLEIYYNMEYSKEYNSVYIDALYFVDSEVYLKFEIDRHSSEKPSEQELFKELESLVKRAGKVKKLK